MIDKTSFYDTVQKQIDRWPSFFAHSSHKGTPETSGKAEYQLYVKHASLKFVYCLILISIL